MAGPYDLAGTGIQAVAQPAALIVTATHLGTRVTQGTANPPNYRNIGQLTPGDADGWYGAVPIRVSPQKIVLPAGVTQLGYGLLAGSTVHVVEVVPPPVLNSSLNPWDRAPQLVTPQQHFQVTGGTADTVAWTYTVPTGKLLAVAKLNAWISRIAAPTTAQYVFAYILINAQYAVEVIYAGTTPGQFVRDEVDAAGMWLPGGAAVAAHYISTDAGGSCWVQLGLAGTLFNA